MDRVRRTGRPRGAWSLSPGHHAAADAGCLYGLNTQHNPWRASSLARRTGGDNDGLLSALPPRREEWPARRARPASFPSDSVVSLLCSPDERPAAVLVTRITKAEPHVGKVEQTSPLMRGLRRFTCSASPPS